MNEIQRIEFEIPEPKRKATEILLFFKLTRTSIKSVHLLQPGGAAAEGIGLAPMEDDPLAWTLSREDPWAHPSESRIRVAYSGAVPVLDIETGVGWIAGNEKDSKDQRDRLMKLNAVNLQKAFEFREAAAKALEKKNWKLSAAMRFFTKLDRHTIPHKAWLETQNRNAGIAASFILDVSNKLNGRLIKRADSQFAGVATSLEERDGELEKMARFVRGLLTLPEKHKSRGLSLSYCFGQFLLGHLSPYRYPKEVPAEVVASVRHTEMGKPDGHYFLLFHEAALTFGDAFEAAHGEGHPDAVFWRNVTREILWTADIFCNLFWDGSERGYRAYTAEAADEKFRQLDKRAENFEQSFSVKYRRATTERLRKAFSIMSLHALRDETPSKVPKTNPRR